MNTSTSNHRQQAKAKAKRIIARSRARWYPLQAAMREADFSTVWFPRFPASMYPEVKAAIAIYARLVREEEKGY